MDLTDEERKKFAGYCYQQARDHDGMSKQM